MSLSAIFDGATPLAKTATAEGVASGIDFEGVTVSYKRTVVLSELNLVVPPGEIVALIGPSGSGKTTALRAVAGFVRPAAGRVKIGGRDITDLPPYARDIGMVVQNYALFPHMRVDENVAFGLRARRTANEIVAARVAECLRMVGMEKYSQRYPRELSGGQQQRVAIARALAIHPRVLLLDEPLSALDAQIRRNMLDELARLHRALPDITVLYVTHDQSEALTLADRIAIMRDGKLASYGRSQDLYRRPPNRFTAEFLGRANLLEVAVEGTAQGLVTARFGERALQLRQQAGSGRVGPCLLCIRPHEVSLSPVEGPSNTLRGTVQSTVWQGDQHHIAIAAGGATIRLVAPPMHAPPAAGSEIDVHFHADHGVLLPDEARG
jgi:2-aminoethylphosphonate transport system ATP-binding protein